MNKREREEAFRQDFEALLEKHGARVALYVDHNEFQEKIAIMDIIMKERKRSVVDEYTNFELAKGTP